MAYYHGLISSRRANSLLTSKPDGTFLIRDSQSQPGSFVLSAKNGPRMHHVLVFQKEGKFHLDSAGEQSEDPIIFETMDEMVSFLIGHDLKVNGEEIHLQEMLPCIDELKYRVRLSSNAATRGAETEDSDQLTNLFATLFGTHCVVICTAHSKLSFDGKPLAKDGKEYMAVIAKDGKQKGFFLRLVDKEEKCVIGEKKVGKVFQYDLPGDLVMTYLSEHGITCIGFRDTREKDRFLHQIDRIVKLHQDRAVKLRGRSESDARPPPSNPTEVVHKMKATDFDIYDISPEWQYLFDQAGITQEMLENTKTLQFILDTVYKIGGEPEKIDSVLEANGHSNGDSGDQTKERIEALTLDANLKRESMRASLLSEELMKSSLTKYLHKSTSHVCSYLILCERFKDHLVVKHSLISLSPENAVCFCEKCAAGKPMVQIAGNPPQQYSLPLGWCQFIHQSQTHKFSQRFASHWHVGYCCVPASRVGGVFRTGQLLHAHSTGKVLLSPDVNCACRVSSIAPETYHDQAMDQHFKVHTVFQVFIQPGTYNVQVATEPSSSTLSTQLEWHVSERTYIIHSLLVLLVPSAN
ncbi:uncharacterized protein LOC135341052 [Halichondria panicea]|uniref:uncharacterized protein LOC135341052 n=1 Tax=Halichondria panicea TaxID=6063 RepID=UPI00312B4F93